LEKKECTNEKLFFDASSRLYQLDPSASSSDKMAKMSIEKGKYSDAIEFAAKAVEMEGVANQKAIYYLGLADAYRNAGSFSLARNAVYSALELRSGWGEAYLNLGNIYIAGAKSCGADFEKSTVYWVAVDAFRRALTNEDTKSRASKSINTYSKYFPTKETCFFNGVEAGKSHTIGCWINVATIARTSD
jgi:tetratricopeptide (TPR) repeat protein